MEDLVAIAKLVRPRGLRGEIVADILTDFPERFETLDVVIGLEPSGDRRELKIENAWFQNQRIILKFEGVDSIEAAEALRNFEICIPESAAATLDVDEFFDWQLEGCEIETLEGETIGTVSSVMRTGGTEILVVAGQGKEFMIPFAESICVEVDVEGKRIVIDPPEGLLEF